LAALLAQFQIAWLAGFHYHPEIAGPGQSPLAVSAIPGNSSPPVGDSGSCPFCQIVRHGVSTPPSTVVLSFQNISTRGRAPLAVTKPIAHAQVRLAGRDPPPSSLASC